MIHFASYFTQGILYCGEDTKIPSLFTGQRIAFARDNLEFHIQCGHFPIREDVDFLFPRAALWLQKYAFEDRKKLGIVEKGQRHDRTPTIRIVDLYALNPDLNIARKGRR